MLKKLFSPVYLAIYSFSIPFFLYFMPSSYYENNIHEYYYYGASFTPVLLIVLSFIFFLIGIRLANTRTFVNKGIRISTPAVNFLIVSLMLVNIIFIINVIIGADIYQQVSTSLSDGGTSSANSNKDFRRSVQNLKNELNLSYLLHFNFAVTAIYSYYIGFRNKSLITKPLFVLWFITAFIAFLLTQSAGILIFFVFVNVIFFIITSTYKLSIRRIFVLGILVVIGVSYFIIIQSLRAGIPLDEISSFTITRFIEYYAGSVNRYAAMIDGTLSFPGTGNFSNILFPIWEMPVLGNYLFGEYFEKGIIESFPVGYFERAGYIYSANLRTHLTSISAFGQLYADMNILYPAIFLPYGYIAQLAWKGLINRRLSFMIIYPFIAWSIFELRGFLELSRPVNVLIYFLFILVLLNEKRRFLIPNNTVR